jgi:hypothetical protein
MEKVIYKERLTAEEREVILLYDGVTKTWRMDTTVIKYYTKAKRQGWRQLKEYVYEDGTCFGGMFEAPDYAVTIRSIDKKVMSEEQMKNLRRFD